MPKRGNLRKVWERAEVRWQACLALLSDSLMESKCGLLQGGGCPTYLSADLCLEAELNSLNLCSQRKLTPYVSIFHGKPWMCQRWDQDPSGSKGRDGGEGTQGHLHIFQFGISREGMWEWSGWWDSWVDVIVTSKQTVALKKHLWSTPSINYQAV